MPRTRPALPAELERRLCLRCGYRGRLLQGDRGRMRFTCPACRCDLYARPARSYAEMEGLLDGAEDSPIPDFWIDAEPAAPIDAPAHVEPSIRRPWLSRLERTAIIGIAIAVGVVVLARAVAGI